MKKVAKEFLDYYLKFYVYEGIDSVFMFFKMYSEFEVTNIEDTNDAVVDFTNYLRDNVSLIKRKENISNAEILKTIEAFNRSISYAVNYYMSDNYKKFASLVYELSPNKGRDSVLEVGAGKIPSSSIWLKEKVDNVLTIDTEFYLSHESLKNMGVDSKEEEFNKNSSVLGSTLVVGRCPCSAISHMVQKCAQANIPYFIKLCDCGLVSTVDNLNGLRPWKYVLPEYDKKVKFYKDYAYNLDVSRDQLERLIEKYDTPSPLRARRPVKIVRVYENGKLLKEEEIVL